MENKKEPFSEERYDLKSEATLAFIRLFHNDKPLSDREDTEIRKKYFLKLENFSNSQIQNIIDILKA